MVIHGDLILFTIISLFYTLRSAAKNERSGGARNGFDVDAYRNVFIYASRRERDGSMTERREKKETTKIKKAKKVVPFRRSQVLAARSLLIVRR